VKIRPIPLNSSYCWTTSLHMKVNEISLKHLHEQILYAQSSPINSPNSFDKLCPSALLSPEVAALLSIGTPLRKITSFSRDFALRLSIIVETDIFQVYMVSRLCLLSQFSWIRTPRVFELLCLRCSFRWYVVL